MNFHCALANGIWIASALPDTLRFRAGMKRAPETQRKILLGIVRRNAETSFGRDHGFSSIRGVREYQQRVPVRSYDELEPILRRVESGEPNVITASPISHFEPTSGSSGPSKMIPHTRELRAEFGRAISPWIGSLAQRNSRAFAGHSYWSLSPTSTQPSRTSGGARIGFDRDDEYLGRISAWLVRAVQAVPGDVSRADDFDHARRRTLLHLVVCRDLSLVSVWHPSFLALLVEPLREIGSRLAEEFATVDSRRADEVRFALTTTHDAPSLHAMIWPDLSAISCWADSSSTIAASDLGRLFPQARIEPKGLLSTEGIISIPFDGLNVLAYRSHFYELRSLRSGDVIAATDAVEGERYSVIITTGGGLYRYATGDIIEVTGSQEGCPILRFVGRGDDISDHFGEKLNEIFVRESLTAALRESDVVARFAVIACERDAVSGRYRLIIESDAPDANVSAVARRMEHLLRQNFHYDYCRRVGQLAAVETFRIARDGAATHLSLLANVRSSRLGAMKPAVLEKDASFFFAFSGQTRSIVPSRSEHA